MALPKVCGIETEYGILVRGAENNPVSASSMLINAYIAASARKRNLIGWDFENEQPSNDARGFSMDESIAPEVETTLVNAVLTNGARYYVDHAHPEISIPEVRTPREVVVWDRAAEEIVRSSGSHFDPKVVDMFLRIPKEHWEEIRLKYIADQAEIPRILARQEAAAV